MVKPATMNLEFFLYGIGYLQLLQLGVQRLAMNAQEARGFRFISSGVGQGLSNQNSFEPSNGFFQWQCQEFLQSQDRFFGYRAARNTRQVLECDEWCEGCRHLLPCPNGLAFHCKRIAFHHRSEGVFRTESCDGDRARGASQARTMSAP